MKRFAGMLVWMGASVATAGCAPADVSGVYSVTVTDGANGCSVPGLTPGNSSSNIPFTITQSGASVTGTVGGTAAIGYGLIFGGNTFTGTVAGQHVDMTINGTVPQSQNGCTFTWQATASGDLAGNALQGTITYRALTTSAPACSTLMTCMSLQQFVGSRPPR